MHTKSPKVLMKGAHRRIGCKAVDNAFSRTAFNLTRARHWEYNLFHDGGRWGLYLFQMALLSAGSGIDAAGLGGGQRGSNGSADQGLLGCGIDGLSKGATGSAVSVSYSNTPHNKWLRFDIVMPDAVAMLKAGGHQQPRSRTGPLGQPVDAWRDKKQVARLARTV
ncbi:MAG: hypothetical protein WCP06_05085 [Verrucomicrobiota bacterium]